MSKQMMIKNKMLKILFYLLLLSENVFSQIQISASVDKNTISLNEQILLQVTVSGNVSNLPNPNIPELSDFQIYSSGRSQNISIINGQVNSSVIFTYILVPKRTGEFILPSINIDYQNKIYQTEPIKIKVEKQSSTQQIPLEKNVYKGSQKGIFIETSVDKKTAYVNEQITLTFRFFTKVNLLSQPQYSPPSTTGFLTEDLPPQRNYYTIINGERYSVTEIRTALFATTAGKFTIGEAIVKCTIEDFDVNNFFSDDFFRRFFSTGKEVILKSQPIEINIMSLPQPQPNLFSGSVGKYSISSSIEKTKLEQNETTFINIKIFGIGNIKSVVLSKSFLEQYLGKNFLIYDPIVSLDIKKENYIVSGSKTFKFPITPLVAGKLLIPELNFTYFDPETKKYENTTSTPLYIDVLPTTKATLKNNPQIPPLKNTDANIELADIRYIYDKYSTVKNLPKNLFLYIQILPLTLWLIFSSYKFYRTKQTMNIKKYLYATAFKKAYKELSKLEKIVDKTKFFEALYIIVSEYFASKIGIKKESLTIEEITKFYSNKISNELSINITDLWNEINFYKFSPWKPENSEFSNYISKTKELLRKLEDETKKI